MIRTTVRSDLSKLRGLPQRIQQRVDDVVDYQAKSTLAAIKSRTPVRTGRLQRGFTYTLRKLKAGDTTVQFRNPVPYFRYVEPKRQMLERGIKAREKPFNRAIRAAVRAAVREANTR